MPNTRRIYMDQVFHEYARIGKVLASEKRVELLHRLIHGAKTVEQLARMSDMSVANTSKHLQVLKEAHLVKISKEGKYIYYSVSSERVEKLLSDIHVLSEEQSPMLRFVEEAYDSSDEAIQTMSPIQAREFVEQGKAVLVDLRSALEFGESHVSGALNIPYNELDKHVQELDKEQPIILYCRGRFCTYANDAAAFLNKQGYEAYSVNITHFDWNRLV